MPQILDTTLREGEQTAGVYFDPHIKIAIAEILDKIGIDYIEAGHPAVSPEIEESVKKIADANLKIKTAAHSRSLKKDVDLALNCGVDFLGVFYCISNGRLKNVFKKTLEESKNQIAEVIRYAKQKKPDLTIRYTPEDTVRSDFKNVIEVSKAAVEAGADIISIADTTGKMIPSTNESMYKYVKKLKDTLHEKGLKPKIAVHCHNDRGLSLANAIESIRAGADIIDASVLGLGERAGIVDLAQIATVLNENYSTVYNLESLPDLYKLVEKHSSINIPVNFPLVGKNAFTHCAGIHTHAAAVDPVHYQSLQPEIVGRKTEICLDHMSGLSSVKYGLKQINADCSKETVREVLKEVKIVGRKGRIVDPEELRYIVKMCKNQNKRS